MLGVDPAPYTLRRLDAMATAKRREAWDHTSALAAAVLNSRQGLKRRHLVSAIDLHPLRESPKRVASREESRGLLAAAIGAGRR